ncbi:MAG TPA: chitobiase/beta-hexosaminidase C-terminal domain-containing protein [Candidatus Acidoferrum sp.]|nr:chitobiase/beta-hexosaminidase C-terminal domain-containing protein [Candidatus Acidoferrum sp.]
MPAATLRAGVQNGVVVSSLCGGGAAPYWGYTNGNPYTGADAKFNYPVGLALNNEADWLFVADCTNNDIRAIDLSSAPPPGNHSYLTWAFVPVPGVTPSGTISRPVGVAVDPDDNVYVLNRGNGKNGTVLEFDSTGLTFAELAWGLTNANAVALDSSVNIYVTASNNLFRIASGTTNCTLVTTVTNAGACLQGVVAMENGMIAVCDSGRHGIYLVNPTNGIVSTNTGFNGAGDNSAIWMNSPNVLVPKTQALFNHPMGLAKAGSNVLVVADYGNNRVKVITATGGVTNLYGVSSSLWCANCNPGGCPGTYPGWADGNVTVPDACGDVEARLPNGVLLAPNGSVYVTEDYYHLIRMVTGAALPTPPPWPPPAPDNLTEDADCGQVVLSWSASPGAGSYNVKRSDSSTGPFTNTLATTSTTSYTDTNVVIGDTYYYAVSAVNSGGEGPNSDSVSATPIKPAAPTIIGAVTNIGQVTLTWTPVSCPGVTYNVKRSPSSGGPYTIISTNITATTYTDASTNLINGATYYYVVSAVGLGGQESDNSAERKVTLPLPPVPDPQIGYVDFPSTSEPVHFTSVFHPVSSSVLNNDAFIVIEGAPGSQTYFIYGPTPLPTNSIPTTNSPSAPVGYEDGMYPPQVAVYSIAQPMPDLTIKAFGHKADGSPDSAVVPARVQYVCGNPAISGFNFYNFAIAEITTNADLFFTLDGTDPSPTNGVDLSTTATLAANTWNVQMDALMTNNVLFKVRAFRANYQPSGIVSNWFWLSNAIAYRISPKSGYYPMGQTVQVMSPGSRVYYTGDGTQPTTNSLWVGLTNSIGYLRWFNSTNDLTGLRVTSFGAGGSSTTVSGLSATTNTIGVPPDFNPVLYAGIGAQIVVPVVVNLQPSVTVKSYQFRVEISPNGGAQPITSGFNALSVGTNDFVPLATVAQGGAVAHITVQPYSLGSTNGLEVFAVGNTNNVDFQNYAVAALLQIPIPFTANEGDSYTLAVSWATATSDGLSDMVPLTLMPPATILVTNVAYTVGDSACNSGGWSVSGGWYNAGDFGNSNLDNADVNLAFDAALGWHVPFSFSDVYNAMDAYPVDAAGFVGGDGMIRFLDWNVILQRSLRMDTNNWARAWSPGGYLVNVPTALTDSTRAQEVQSKSAPVWPWYRQTLVGAVSVGNTLPGSAVSVPVYVKLADGATLSGLQFRAVVTPQGGAPALAQAPQFSPAAGVAGPTLQQGFAAGQAGFGWALGSFNYLSRSSNFLGWVSFTVPATARSGQLYSVSFPNADGAPNMDLQYDFETRSAWVAVGGSAPQASICSDEWKLHFFGSLTNPAAGDMADADGDGVPNWMEYVAGTDPTDPASRLKLNGPARQPGKGLLPMGLSWLTAPGKGYALQWCSNAAKPSWSTLATLSGDGTVANVSDTNLNVTARYYRLVVLP